VLFPAGFFAGATLLLLPFISKYATIISEKKLRRKKGRSRVQEEKPGREEGCIWTQDPIFPGS